MILTSCDNITIGKMLYVTSSGSIVYVSLNITAWPFSFWWKKEKSKTNKLIAVMRDKVTKI